MVLGAKLQLALKNRLNQIIIRVGLLILARMGRLTFLQMVF